MGNDTESEDWKEWLWREFQGLETFADPVAPLRVSEEPWAEKLTELAVQALYPKLHFQKGGKLTAKRLGYLLGSTDAKAVWFRLTLWSDQLPAEAKPEEISEEDEKTVIEWMGQFDQYFDKLRRLTKRAFLKCVDQTYEEMSDYLKGFAEGFREMPFGTVKSYRSRLLDTYLLLLMLSKFIKFVPSVTALHEIIVRVQGPLAAGDKSRTEKICQRIGLRFGPKGRPKKAKIRKT